MAKVSLNVSYWKQSTGLTGQNLNEDNQRKYARIATKFEKRTGMRLSKMRLYHGSRIAARQVKEEVGSRIMSNSKTTFDALLTAVDQRLNGKNNPQVDLGVFNVSSILELACKPTGALAHRKRQAS